MFGVKNMLKIGEKIKELRKAQNVTQEKLADYLNISYQAVSKWEQQISCPDIMLLPELAKIFGVTIDELFGNTSNKVIVYSFVGNVPWNDDGKLRIAVYSGRKLMEQSEHVCAEGINLINLQFHGEQYNVNGVCKVNCIKADKE